MKEKIILYKNQYFSNYHNRLLATTYISFFTNLSIGIGKIVLGLFYSSFWLVITGGYYFILSLARGHILYEVKELKGNYKRQMIVYHRSGWFVMGLSFIYLILCLWMYTFNEKTTYPGYILYAVVLVAFYKVGSAIYGLIIAKRNKSLLLSVIKVINFLDACVSIVAIQCALLVMEQSEFASSSSAQFGIGISILFLIIGFLMIRKKGDYTKAISKE